MKFVSRLLLAALMSFILLFSSAYAAENTPGGSKNGGVVKLSGDIYVNEGNTVEGDAVTINGNIYINGSVTGNAVAVFGDIYVNGKVLGDAVSVTGKVTVGDNGKVLGNTVEALGGSARGPRNPGYYRPNLSINPWSSTARALFSFFTSLGMFLIAALIYLIMPRRIDEMAASVEPNLGRRLGIGVLTLIGSPIAMIILSIVLAITIIGIIVIPFAWIAYFIAIFIGTVPVYIYIGRKVAAAVSRPVMSSYAALAAGLVTLWIIRVAASFGGFYTGWISGIISFLIYVAGVGTLLDYLFSNRSRRPSYAQYPPYPPQGNGYSQDTEYPKQSYVPEEKKSSPEGNSSDFTEGKEKQE